jgi:hypothetical protein
LQWLAAKEELHSSEEDEEDKALFDLEAIEKKRQKEIEVRIRFFLGGCLLWHFYQTNQKAYIQIECRSGEVNSWLVVELLRMQTSNRWALWTGLSLLDITFW